VPTGNRRDGEKGERMSTFEELETSASMLGFRNVTISVDVETRVVILQCEDADGNKMTVEVDGVQVAIDRMHARLAALLNAESPAPEEVH
jgi:hypothetical protein